LFCTLSSIRRPAGAELGLFCAPTLPPGQLGSFRAIRPQIGFVLHIWPSVPARNRRLPIRNPGASGPPSGFVLHISLPGRATHHTTNAFAHILQSPQVWLRFEQLPPSAACGGAKLGSFRTNLHLVGPGLGWNLGRPRALHPQVVSLASSRVSRLSGGIIRPPSDCLDRSIVAYISYRYSYRPSSRFPALSGLFSAGRPIKST
jgi:hypothetical protein